jgi:hypothetical protein
MAGTAEHSVYAQPDINDTVFCMKTGYMVNKGDYFENWHTIKFAFPVIVLFSLFWSHSCKSAKNITRNTHKNRISIFRLL